MAIDKEGVEALGGFLMRALLSLLAVVFCCIMLYKKSDDPIYIGLLSSIVSLWMPSSTLSISDVVRKVRELTQMQTPVVVEA